MKIVRVNSAINVPFCSNTQSVTHVNLFSVITVLRLNWFIANYVTYFYAESAILFVGSAKYPFVRNVKVDVICVKMFIVRNLAISVYARITNFVRNVYSM